MFGQGTVLASACVGTDAEVTQGLVMPLLAQGGGVPTAVMMVGASPSSSFAASPLWAGLGMGGAGVMVVLAHPSVLAKHRCGFAALCGKEKEKETWSHWWGLIN